MKILLTIQYVGTCYAGYQVQNNGITIQGCLTEAAERLFGFPCDITGCSRTDSGVHANMFCATVTRKGCPDIETTLPQDKLPRVMNSFLPGDISVISAAWVSEEFHPRYDVKYKEYVYKIWNKPEKNPFLNGRAWHYPREISEEKICEMRRAAALFVGTYDFSSYMAQGSSVSDTVRTINYADVTKEGDLITFRVAGNGFLYNMVRIMTGTLISVAEGKINDSDIPKITEARDRRMAGITAPADGLYLNKVVY